MIDWDYYLRNYMLFSPGLIAHGIGLWYVECCFSLGEV
jgi:hypothetical protein